MSSKPENIDVSSSDGQVAVDEHTGEQTFKPLLLESGMIPWNDYGPIKGLCHYLNVKEPNWTSLANQVSKRMHGQFCFSSDGQSPKLEPLVKNRLNAVNREAQRLVLEQVKGSRPSMNNDALRYLSWQFDACPPTIVESLLEAVTVAQARILQREASEPTDKKGVSIPISHPWLNHHSSERFIFHALGRVVSKREHRLRLLDIITTQGIERWKVSQETACLAMMISRAKTFGSWLTDTHLERIGEHLAFQLRTRTNDTRSDQYGLYSSLRNILWLIAAVLRTRRVVSVNGRSALLGWHKVSYELDRVRSSLQTVEKNLSKHCDQGTKLEKQIGLTARYLQILVAIESCFDGYFGDENLLNTIYELESGL